MKKVYIYSAFILFFSLVSCTDLDRFPKDGPASETFPKNEEELMIALNGIYAKNSTHAAIDNIPTTTVLDACSDIGYDRNSGGIQQIGNGDINTNNDFVLSVWKVAYEVIARCNFMLDNMHKAQSSVSKEKYTALEAEARFVRLYTYHYLIEYYGGVPLVTKMLNLNESLMPRTSKEDIVKFIFDEIEDIKDSLSKGYTGKGRASKAAALAIKARTALYNKKWEIAASAAKEIIDMEIYDLHDDFGKLFSYEGEKSKETIWAHQYLSAAGNTSRIPACLLSRNGKGFSNKVPSQSLVDAYQCIDGMNIDVSPLYNPKKPFENRDPRLGYTVALPGSIFYGYQFETHRDSIECWNYNVTPAVRVENQDGVNAYATFTGYCWKKYVDERDKANPHSSEIGVAIIRYAEILLIYAEAKIEDNKIDQSVYDAINKVRQRKTVEMPAIPDHLSQSDLRSIVRKERLYELAMEGFRMIDIRRWEIADKVMSGPFYGRIPKGLLSSAPKIDVNGIPDYSNVANHAEMRVVEQRKFNNNKNRDYLWPIPERERTANPNLEQNPGY